MTDVYIDESGYTGDDLFNAEQRVFVVASTDLSNEEVAKLLRPITEDARSAEVKHKRLSKSSPGRRKVLTVIQDAIAYKDRITTYPMHKRFVLFQKFVDCWLEPVMHSTGHNFYKRGENITFCNTAYLCLTVFEGEEFLNSLLEQYQRLMLNPSPEAFERFWWQVRLMANSCKPKSREFMKYFVIVPEFLDFGHVHQLGERANDIALTAALATIAYWSHRATDEIRVVHDESSNMADAKWMWDALTSPDVPSATVGHGDYRDVMYPLRVAETRFEKSHNRLQLQLCDIIAGATNAFCKSRIQEGYRGGYGDALEKAGIQDFVKNQIWPSSDWVPPLNNRGNPAQDPLDFAAELIGKAREKLNTPAQ